MRVSRRTWAASAWCRRSPTKTTSGRSSPGDNERYRENKLDAYRLMSKSMSLSYMTMRIVQLFVMIAGAYFVLHRQLTVGGFMGFLLLVNVFFRPVEKINAVLETYPKGIAGFKRYLELLETAPDIADAPDAVEMGHLQRRDPLRERHASATKRTRTCWRTSIWRSIRARRSRLSGRAGRARRPSARWCRASTSRTPGASPSTASTSGR